MRCNRIFGRRRVTETICRTIAFFIGVLCKSITSGAAIRQACTNTAGNCNIIATGFKRIGHAPRLTHKLTVNFGHFVQFTLASGPLFGSFLTPVSANFLFGQVSNFHCNLITGQWASTSKHCLLDSAEYGVTNGSLLSLAPGH